ncbi:MAG: hypothetical protein Q8910_04785 [Bacteroidota bacterium]|nr:hypothetical protein [Bacteroidota bacterium]
MNKWKFIIVLACSGFLYSSVVAQKVDIPADDNLNLAYSKSDQRKIDKANSQIEESKKLMGEAETLFQPDISLADSNKECNKTAYLKMKEASDAFSNANKIKYETNEKYIARFWEKVHGVYVKELVPTKTLERESKIYYKAAQDKRQQSLLMTNYTKAYMNLVSSLNLEFTAIQKQNRVLRKYQDWPVLYAYDWEEKVKPDEVPNNPSNFAVVDSSKKSVNAEKKEELIAPVIFKVQIAAHTIPLSEQYLRTLYTGNYRIDMIYEDGWYRYSIGTFDNFKAANDLLNKTDVPRAFVIAYQNGKKIKVKEAVKLTRELSQYQE